MIFQCESSELEKAIAKIKQWEVAPDVKQKTIKSILLKPLPPPRVTFHVHEIYPKRMEISISSVGKKNLYGQLKGEVLSYMDTTVSMTLNDFYSLCETLPDGEVQIEANYYEITLCSI